MGKNNFLKHTFIQIEYYFYTQNQKEGMKMDNQKFINRCIAIVQQRIENEYSDSSGACPDYNVFVVWSCKTLQNNKAILSANLKGAPLFEITHNGDKNEMYVDTYTKKSNECIKV